jgi:hypothetical protein
MHSPWPPKRRIARPSPELRPAFKAAGLLGRPAFEIGRGLITADAACLHQRLFFATCGFLFGDATIFLSQIEPQIRLMALNRH